MNPDDSLDKLPKSLRNNNAYEIKKIQTKQTIFFKGISIYD